MTSHRRPTLGIIDPSDGPSGLSRYLELLWPMLTGHFEVVVFGDPKGPYSAWTGGALAPLPSSLLHKDWKTVKPVQPGTPTSTPGRSIGRSVYHRFAPKWFRRKLGLSKDASQLAAVLKKYNVTVAFMPLCDLEYFPHAASMAGIRRRVGTFHLPPPAASGFATKRMLRSMLNRLTGSIAVSARIGAEWVALDRRIKSSMTVVPNGIDKICPSSQIERKQVLRKLSLDDIRRPLWVAAGRLTEQKGFTFLVDAVAQLKRKKLGLTVVIAGEGPNHERLAEQIRRNDLAQEVRLLGQVAELPLLLQAADGFVLSSISEALPYALLEAMVLGLPVVATAVGGVPELVRDQESGVLCEPGSVEALEAGIEQCLRDEVFARRIGDLGREVVTDLFSAATMRQKTLEVLTGQTPPRSKPRSNDMSDPQTLVH
jgi:glycosyltransferase involved in cell wall biosynthesis